MQTLNVIEYVDLRCFMLKRKATDYIKNWLNTKDRKCLVVQGARQTGKTYIIERFAEENFEELVEINFKQMPSAMAWTSSWTASYRSTQILRL